MQKNLSRYNQSMHVMITLWTITTFPYSQFKYLSSNIPESPAHGVFCSSTVTYDWFPVSLCASWQVPHAGNSHSFPNTWLHYLWGVHDFIHSLYIHYRICQSDCFVLDMVTLKHMTWNIWLIRYIHYKQWPLLYVFQFRCILYSHN